MTIDVSREIDKLGHWNRSVITKAERSLRTIGSADLSLIASGTRHSEPLVRARIATILGHIKSPESYLLLLQMLDDQSVDVLYDVYLALGRVGDPRAVPVLIGAIVEKTGTDDGLAPTATQGLAMYGDLAVAEVTRIFEGSSELVQCQLLFVLGGAGTDLAFSALAEWTNNESKNVRWTAIDLLSAHYGSRACPFIAECIHDSALDIANTAQYWHKDIQCPNKC